MEKMPLVVVLVALVDCLEWSMVGSANEIVNIGAFTPAGVYLEQSFVIQKSGEEGETFKFCE